MRKISIDFQSWYHDIPLLLISTQDFLNCALRILLNGRKRTKVQFVSLVHIIAILASLQFISLIHYDVLLDKKNSLIIVQQI